MRRTGVEGVDFVTVGGRVEDVPAEHKALIQVGRWPESLPRTYGELSVQQGAFIVHLLRRYNSVDSDIRDLCQHVWAQLQSSDVLLKYAESVADIRPETLTVPEAMDFLQCKTFSTYNWLVYKVKKLDPEAANLKPVNGVGSGSKAAVWRFEDVMRLATSDFGWGKTKQVKCLPVKGYAVRHFQGYLTRAVRNHFINWCRTRVRRHKERPGDNFPALSPKDRDGLQDRTSWENNIPDMSCSPETQTELREKLHRVGPALLKLDASCAGSGLHETVDELTRRREVAANLEAERRGIKPPVEPASVAEAAGHCILSDLEDGRSLREAILRLDVTLATKKTILRAIQLG